MKENINKIITLFEMNKIIIKDNSNNALDFLIDEKIFKFNDENNIFRKYRKRIFNINIYIKKQTFLNLSILNYYYH